MNNNKVLNHSIKNITDEQRAKVLSVLRHFQSEFLPKFVLVFATAAFVVTCGSIDQLIAICVVSLVSIISKVSSDHG